MQYRSISPPPPIYIRTRNAESQKRSATGSNFIKKRQGFAPLGVITVLYESSISMYYMLTLAAKEVSGFSMRSQRNFWQTASLPSPKSSSSSCLNPIQLCLKFRSTGKMRSLEKQKTLFLLYSKSKVKVQWSSGQSPCLQIARPGFEYRPGTSPQCGLRGGRSHCNTV